MNEVSNETVLAKELRLLHTSKYMILTTKPWTVVPDIIGQQWKAIT